MNLFPIPGTKDLEQETMVLEPASEYPQAVIPQAVD